MKTFVAEKNCKLSKMLLEKYEGKLSYAKFNELIRSKDIKVNGKRTKEDLSLQAGDVIDVYYDGTNVKINTKIIFEDDNVLIAVKPKNILSEIFFESLKNDCESLYFCHRLDRNTDGVMVFAKSQKAYEEIFDAFKNKTFEKTYVAEVYGRLSNKSGRLVHYLSKDNQLGRVKAYINPQKDTKKAVLEYSVIDFNERTTTVEILLLTGRTHQIRVQMSAIGHFVLGDGKYGNDSINKQLHVKELRLSSTKLTLHFDKNSPLFYLDGRTFKKI